MKVKAENSLKQKVLDRINQMPGNVILRKDLDDLGGYRQLSRALNILIKENKIVRISLGVYSKLKQSKYFDEPVLSASFDDIVVETLNRLGVQWDLTIAQKSYNEGKTTQVPVRVAVRLNSRFRRELSYGNNKLYYERNINHK